MPSINDVRKLIYNTFITAWSGQTPIDLQNGEFNEPESGPWVRLTVKGVDSRQSTLGKTTNRKYLREGKAFVQVFTDIDIGTSVADELAQEVRDIFEGTRLSAATWINDSVVREVGPDGKWYQYIVESDFTYEEIK